MAKRKSKKLSSRNFSFKNWWKDGMGGRKSILKFWLYFAGIMLLFYVLAVQPFYIQNIQEPISGFFASASSGVLNMLGQSTQASGMNITSSSFSLSIRKGCDAIAPIVLVLTGIWLFPAKWRQRWVGISIGVLVLFTLNLIRIVSLYFIGVHAPEWFEFMHIEFWQVVFVGLAILYLFYWLNWVSKTNTHAPAS